MLTPAVNQCSYSPVPNELNHILAGSQVRRKKSNRACKMGMVWVRMKQTWYFVRNPDTLQFDSALAAETTKMEAQAHTHCSHKRTPMAVSAAIVQDLGERVHEGFILGHCVGILFFLGTQVH
jgi:hypothetical protein